MNIRSASSYIREIVRDGDIIPTAPLTSEEHLSLTPLRQIDPNRWGIDTIESFSLAKKENCRPRDLWQTPILCKGTYWKDLKVTLDYFIDGVQRTSQIGIIPFRDLGYESVPLHLSQVGCATLKRRDRHLEPIVEIEQIRFFLLAPIQFLLAKTNKKRLKNLLEQITIDEEVGPGISWFDTSFSSNTIEETPPSSDGAIEFDALIFQRIPDSKLFSWLADPNRFRHHHRYWSTRIRDRLERKVQSDLVEKISPQKIDRFELIVRDGSLRDIGGIFEKNAIGLVKSIRTQYLGSDYQASVINLPLGYRSPVFIINRPYDLSGEAIAEETSEPLPKKRSKWLSWFLRIREHRYDNHRFGLVRIEIDPSLTDSRGSSDNWTRDDSIFINAISQVLCKERFPSAYPGPREGNLIYPVALCEKYLRSRLISHDVVKNLCFTRLVQ